MPTALELLRLMGNILLVDDDKNLRTILGRFLKQDGHKVYEARTAREAFSTLCETKADAIILDVMMHGSSGLDLCRRLKGIPEQSEIPIIICTAMSRREDIVEAIQSGADDFIVKPFTRDVVRKKVADVLSRPIKPAKNLKKADDSDSQERRGSGRAAVDWMVSWAGTNEFGSNTIFKNKVVNISPKGFGFEFDRCKNCTGYEVSTIHPNCMLAPNAGRFKNQKELDFVLSISRDVIVEVTGYIAHAFQPEDSEKTEVVGVAITSITPEGKALISRHS